MNQSLQNAGSSNAHAMKEEASKKTEIEMVFNAFIPNTINHEWFQNSMAWLDEPGSTGTLFSSDNRSYEQEGTSRISHVAKATINSFGIVESHSFNTIKIGESHQAERVTSGIWPFEETVGIKNIKTETAPNKGENKYTSSIDSDDGRHQFNMRGEASYPFSSMAPDIDFDVTYHLHTYSFAGKATALVWFAGIRNDFPAYEGFLRVNGKRENLYTYKVGQDDGPGLINLNSSSVAASDSVASIDL